MEVKRCSCRRCRTGLRTKSNSEMVKKLRRSYRHKVKEILKAGGWENLPVSFSVPYTD